MVANLNLIFARLAVPLLAIIAGTTAFAAEPAFTRESVTEFVKDKEKLNSLIWGINVMKRRDSAPMASASYRTSWQYWANIHGFPGPNSPSGTVEKVRKGREDASSDAPLFVGFFSGLKDFTAPDKLAEELWAKCEHDSPNAPTIHFLTWHRMYLFFFEQVLRRASGNEKLALPYWDYTNDDPAKRAWALPSIFGQSTVETEYGPFDNPVYERRRTSGFASAVQLDTGLTNVDGLLKYPEFLGPFQTGFQSTLERGLHGHIHCTVGNRCLAPFIGIVPFAANDPIFWLHHANIDRLWSCWTNLHGEKANPVGDPSWMGKTFAFVNVNGDRVEMPVAELFDRKGRINYTYDNIKNCFRGEEKTPVVVSAAPDTGAPAGRRLFENLDIAKNTGVAIRKVSENVPLVGLPRSKVMMEGISAAREPGAKRDSRVVLELKNVTFTREPGASIGVHLTDSKGSRREFAGIISTFGLFEHTGHAHGPPGRSSGFNVAFDVTDQFRKLMSGQAPNEDLQVSFIATTGLAGSATEVSPASYEAAGLRIEEVTIRIMREQ